MYTTLKDEIQKEMSFNVPLNDIMARIHQYFIQNAIHYDKVSKKNSRSPKNRHEIYFPMYFNEAEQ